MKRLVVLTALSLCACSQPDYKCKQVALGSSPAHLSPMDRLPLSLPQGAGSDIVGPVIQLVCCQSPAISGTQDDCPQQSFTCPAPAATKEGFDDPGYSDNDGTECTVWVEDGKVIARAWVTYD